MTILDDLWNGDIHPAEQKIPPDSQQRKHLRQAGHYHELLNQTLSPEAKDLLDALLNESYLAEGIAQRSSFIHGFQTGAKMMIDVFHPADQGEAALYR